MKKNSFLPINLFKALAFAPLSFALSHAQEIVTLPNNDSFSTYASSSIFNWDLNGNTTSNSPVAYDQIIAFNNGRKLQVSSGATFNIIFGNGVNLADSFWSSNQAWTVFSGFNASGSSGQFTLGSITAGANGYTLAANRPGASFSIGPVTNGAVTLSYSAAAFVPEPTSALAGILLVGGLLRRRR